MEKDLEFDKAVENFVEDMNRLENATGFIEDGWWVETGSGDQAMLAYDDVKDLNESLKELKEEFGSELIEAAREKIEQDFDGEKKDLMNYTLNEFESGGIDRFEERWEGRLDSSAEFSL